MINQLVRYVTHDDQFTWSKEEIAKELPGFHFKGPGWYSKDGTWMLIIGTDVADIYTLQVFYDRDPRIGYRAIAEAPVHSTDVVEAAVATVERTFSYSGLIVMVVGMFIMLPLSVFLLHNFHAWGFLALLIFAFMWGQFARWVGTRGKKNKGKSNEQRTG